MLTFHTTSCSIICGTAHLGGFSDEQWRHCGAVYATHLQYIYATIRIVVVTGVAQAQSVSAASPLEAFAHNAKLSLVAPRLSDKKFTGRGTTNTGKPVI
jgi:hypothetical protein